MTRLVWHELHHPHVNPALLIGAVWLTLAVIAAIYDIGRWVNAW
jgi:hypothetical protein